MHNNVTVFMALNCTLKNGYHGKFYVLCSLPLLIFLLLFLKSNKKMEEDLGHSDGSHHRRQIYNGTVRGARCLG